MIRVLLCALFAAGGVAALICEVTWMRAFRTVLGSSAQSAVSVLAACLVGIAIGNLIGGRMLARDRLVRRFAFAQVSVGLTALLVLPLLAFYTAVYPEIHQWADGHHWLLPLCGMVFSFLAMGPATIAMGVTLPLVAQASVRDPAHVARRTGIFYSLYMFGAVLGTLAAGCVLPTTLGTSRTIHLSVAVNLVIGAIAFFLPEPVVARREEAQPAAAATSGRRHSGMSTPFVILAAAISGYCTLSLGFLFARMLGQIKADSAYGFAIVVAILLTCLAAAFAVVSRWLDRGNAWRFLAWTQLGGGIAVLVSPWLFTLVPLVPVGPSLGQQSLAADLAKHAICTAFVVGPPVLLIGVVLPSTWRIASSRVSDVGRHVGTLTAWHAVAAVTGALVTRFVCVPLLGLDASVAITASLCAVLAAVCFLLGHRGVLRWLGLAAPVVIVAGWVYCGAWRLPAQPVARGEKLVSYRDGEAATVVVIESADGHRRMTMNRKIRLRFQRCCDP